MSEMVEKVAGALAERFKAIVAGMAGLEFGVTGVSLPKEDVWLDYARAAIEAMRIPTPAMNYVGSTKCEEMMFGGDPEYTGVIFTDMGVVFRTMIDAALTSPAPSPIPGPSENTESSEVQPKGE